MAQLPEKAGMRFGLQAVIACMCLAAAVVVLGGTSRAATSSGARQGAATVTPQVSLMSSPVHIALAHLAPGRASVTVTSTDATGVQWAATATYPVGTGGRLDLDRAPALGGSYRGVHGMGLIWSMRAESAAAGAPYWWSIDARRFDLTATQGDRVVASTGFYRRVSRAGVSSRPETLDLQGFVGRFATPAGKHPRRPAILAFGGSEGGLSGSLLAGALASAGYPVLDIAYFKAPGLPDTLSKIPLEYFAKALRWLGRQPGVDPEHIDVLGVSRGSEAAQLLGVHYPGLVHGVIAGVPSNVALCSYPGCTGPAWTLHGRAVPYTRQFDNPHPTDDPAAVIPDERIRGPVLLVCGGSDRVWTSCPFARAIEQRLTHFPYRHPLLAFPAAGHGAGGFVRYEPSNANPSTDGRTPEANALALERIWPRLLGFLRS